jgi:hypothetical protein
MGNFGLTTADKSDIFCPMLYLVGEVHATESRAYRTCVIFEFIAPNVTVLSTILTHIDNANRASLAKGVSGYVRFSLSVEDVRRSVSDRVLELLSSVCSGMFT